MVKDEFEVFLLEKNNQINLFIDAFFKEDNDVQISLNNLEKLVFFIQQNNITIDMIDIDNLLNNEKLNSTLKNIVLNINNEIFRKLNNDILTTLISNFCKKNNIYNNYLNILINSTINPYDSESQKKLIKRVQEGDKQAKELLILANDTLVRMYVSRNKYKIKNTSLDEDDLMQVGRLGIIEAANNFDFNRNVRFSTYAIFYLIKNINREIHQYSRTIKIPVNLYRLVNEYKYIENLYMTKYGVIPNDEEFAQKMKISLEKVKEIKAFKSSIVSLEKEVRGSLDSEDGTMIESFISDESQNFEEDVIYNLYLQEIKEKIDNSSNITERNKIIIKLRYGMDDHIIRTYDAIAEIFHLKKERIRQIIDSNLEKIGYDNRLNKIDRPIRECVPRRKKNIC